MQKQTPVEWLFAHLLPHLDWSKRENKILFRQLEQEALNMEEEQQLPQQEISDEEIEKAAEDWQEFRQGAGKQSFEKGAKWYREQLKQR